MDKQLYFKFEDIGEQDIKILDPNTKSYRRWAYKPKRQGEAAFILNRCKEEGLFAKYEIGNIVIYSVNKLHIFQKIIDEAKSFIKNSCKIQEGSTCYKLGKMILCVTLKQDEIEELFVTEGHFKEVVLQQFKNKLPMIKLIKIFNSQSEMVEYLETRNILI